MISAVYDSQISRNIIQLKQIVFQKKDVEDEAKMPTEVEASIVDSGDRRQPQKRFRMQKPKS